MVTRTQRRKIDPLDPREVPVQLQIRVPFWYRQQLIEELNTTTSLSSLIIDAIQRVYPPKPPEVRIVGVDPGVTGAIALLIGGVLADVVDMPCNDSRVDGSHVAAIFDLMAPDVVVVEDTQPMPKNGSIASFKLGLNTGIVLGVAQAQQHPLVRIRPIDWKRANGLVGKTKDASRGLASELWPAHAESFRLVKNDGRAEAGLIARGYIIRLIHERNAS